MSYKIFKYLVAENRRQFLFALVLSIAGGWVELLGVGTIYPFLSLLNRPELIHQRPILSWLYAAGQYSSERQFIFYVGVASVAFFALASLFTFFKNAYITRFSLRQMAKIPVRLLQNYLSRPYAFFLDQNSGEISKNILSQSDTVANGVLLAWMTAISESFVLVAILSLVLYVDFKTGLTAALALGLIVGVIQYTLKGAISRLGKQSDEANGQRFVYCMQTLQSVKEIKVAQKEHFFCKTFEAPAQKMASAYTRVNVLQMLPQYLTQTIVAVFIVGLGLFYLSRGKELSSIAPLLSLYVIAGYRLMPSLTRFSGAVSQLRQHQAAFENVIDILAISPRSAPSSAQKGAAASFTGAIEFRDVSFSYPNGRYAADAPRVLSHLNLTIGKNTIVALVGRSGAGKTTLADILLGLFPLKDGEIWVDGQRLREENLSKWGKLIGYIPQSIYLADDTIAGNIAFGLEPSEFDWERIRKVAQMSHLDDWISQLPEGFKTRIGERGARLSGGQRQRLGIARALYTDPQILVLDESTNALDGITEQSIVRTIRELKREKTILIIAHRNSTIRDSDKIVLLDKGKIADAGSYDELIKKNAHFAELMSDPNLFRQTSDDPA